MESFKVLVHVHLHLVIEAHISKKKEFSEESAQS